jgi:hypothetical protein
MRNANRRLPRTELISAPGEDPGRFVAFFFLDDLADEFDLEALREFMCVHHNPNRIVPPSANGREFINMFELHRYEVLNNVGRNGSNETSNQEG